MGDSAHLCLSSDLRGDIVIVLGDAAGRKKVVSPNIKLHVQPTLSISTPLISTPLL